MFGCVIFLVLICRDRFGSMTGWIKTDFSRNPPWFLAIQSWAGHDTHSPTMRILISPAMSVMYPRGFILGVLCALISLAVKVP